LRTPWDLAPPCTPLRGARRVGPSAHDRSRELEFEAPAPVGAIPLADRPVEPLRGDEISHFRFAEVTNLNQDLTHHHQLFKSLTEFLQTFHAAVTTQRWDCVNLTV